MPPCKTTHYGSDGVVAQVKLTSKRTHPFAVAPAFAKFPHQIIGQLGLGVLDSSLPQLGVQA
jgi:hypothetical protein